MNPSIPTDPAGTQGKPSGLSVPRDPPWVLAQGCAADPQEQGLAVPVLSCGRAPAASQTWQVHGQNSKTR